MLDELAHGVFTDIGGFRLEPGEASHANNVAIGAQYRGCVAYVLHGASIHHGAVLKLQGPTIFVGVHGEDVHTEVLGCFLGAQPCSKAWVHEHETQGFVFAEVLKSERVVFQG